MKTHDLTGGWFFHENDDGSADVRKPASGLGIHLEPGEVNRLREIVLLSAEEAEEVRRDDLTPIA